MIYLLLLKLIMESPIVIKTIVKGRNPLLSQEAIDPEPYLQSAFGLGLFREEELGQRYLASLQYCLWIFSDLWDT